MATTTLHPQLYPCDGKKNGKYVPYEIGMWELVDESEEVPRSVNAYRGDHGLVPPPASKTIWIIELSLPS